MADKAQDTGEDGKPAQQAAEAEPDAIPDKPADNPPKKRGRPKGLKKTGGRKKGQQNWTTPEIRDALLGRSEAIDTLADIVAGRQLLVSGPTGKEVWRRATLPERLKAVEIVLKKCVPDLQATELTGADGADLFPAKADPPDRRQLARAVLAVLNRAELEDGNTDTSDDSVSSDTAAALNGGAAGVSGSSASPSAPEKLNGAKPEIGTIEQFGDASMLLIEISGDSRERWAILDKFGQRLASAWGRDEAERRCREFSATGRISIMNANE